jgi:hypothetical protein
MKKLTSLILAVVSTMFLFVGATKAAEKFDSTARCALPAIADAVELLPLPPCSVPDEPPQRN